MRSKYSVNSLEIYLVGGGIMSIMRKKIKCDIKYNKQTTS
jgi:hypothetical protein